MENPAPLGRRYWFGPFELDPVEGRLAKHGTRVKLQDLPLRLMAMLVERPGEIVTLDEVRQRLWPDNTFEWTKRWEGLLPSRKQSGLLGSI